MLRPGPCQQLVGLPSVGILLQLSLCFFMLCLGLCEHHFGLASLAFQMHSLFFTVLARLVSPYRALALKLHHIGRPLLREAIRRRLLCRRPRVWRRPYTKRQLHLRLRRRRQRDLPALSWKLRRLHPQS